MSNNRTLGRHLSLHLSWLVVSATRMWGGVAHLRAEIAKVAENRVQPLSFRVLGRVWACQSESCPFESVPRRGERQLGNLHARLFELWWTFVVPHLLHFVFGGTRVFTLRSFLRRSSGVTKRCDELTETLTSLSWTLAEQADGVAVLSQHLRGG
jgi:hypothetical protein